jgi:hypothetical protein
MAKALDMTDEQLDRFIVDMQHRIDDGDADYYGINDTFEEAKVIAEELVKLKQRDLMLSALEGAGVDNWEGYDYAMEELEKES